MQPLSLLCLMTLSGLAAGRGSLPVDLEGLERLDCFSNPIHAHTHWHHGKMSPACLQVILQFGLVWDTWDLNGVTVC